MKQVIQNLKTGELQVVEVPPPFLKESGLLVRNASSLISAGTERSTVSAAKSSLIGKARQRPDLVKQVLDNLKREGILNTYKKVQNRLDTPKALGYSSAGTVIEVARGLDEFQVGDRVACGGGEYACHAEVVFVPMNLCVQIPSNVSFDEAAFTTVGAIAMQGVRQAETRLGDNMAVIGLGLLGQITVQILKAAGCNVLGIDIDKDAVALALELGADEAVIRSSDDVERISNLFSRGHGMDAVLITAGTTSNDPIELAGQILRDKGTVVIVGAVKADIPRSPFYEKELEVKLSRSYGPGRYDSTYEEKGIDYPIGYVRWTEKRNMEAFLKLVADRKIDLKRITTHKFQIEEAHQAYDVVTGKTNEKSIGVLFNYDQYDATRLHNKVIVDNTAGPKDQINIGFIGAGNFAQSYLLPNLRKLPGVNLKGVATATGINAKNAAEKFRFEYCTTEVDEILNDVDINCVFIATRHNLHASLVCKALSNGKDVFVEKPLALTTEELSRLVKTYDENRRRLMVGFNRRFAPMMKQVKNFFENRKEPMVINYRINAGFIPKTHWTQDPEQGGGRILGEVCHFIDLIQFLTESEPVKVFAETISGFNSEIIADDNVGITIKMKDGSLSIISYLANGAAELPKERIEIFAEQSTAILENFKKATLYKNGKVRKMKGSSKGHKEELDCFFEALKNGSLAPIEFQDLFLTTQATLKILESLRKGMPVSVCDE